jgi:isopenicillin N synthase-like dioxygenase
MSRKRRRATLGRDRSSSVRRALTRARSRNGFDRTGNLSTVDHAESTLARCAAGNFAPDYLWQCTRVTTVDLHRPLVQAAKWPPDLMPFWDLAHRYAVAMGTLSRLLMRISAIALDLNENYFDDVYAGMTTKLRFAIYPDQVEPPAPGQYRNAPHTDFNGFTILRQDDAPGGLQVQLADGEWIDVLPVAGSLVINAGHLVQRWTNDRWRSNVHRVINPPRALTGSAQRLSIVLFTGPDPRAEIACLPGCAPAGSAGTYPPIIAGDHVREKVRLTLGTL